MSEGIRYGCGCIVKGLGSEAPPPEQLPHLTCPRCRRAAYDEAEAAVLRSGKLPPLTGAEAHIRWGTQVRDRLIDELEAYVRKSVQPTPAERPFIDKLLARARSRTEAAFWWDMRGVGARSLFATLQAEMMREGEELERLKYTKVGHGF